MMNANERAALSAAQLAELDAIAKADERDHRTYDRECDERQSPGEDWDRRSHHEYGDTTKNRPWGLR
jgi:hypothetical protein